MATETAPRHPGLTDGPIYLDYNATTPVDPRVVAAALPYLTEHFGNPSSTHHYGQAPARPASRTRPRRAAALPRPMDHRQGRWTTASEVEQAAQLIAAGVAHLARS